MRIPPSPPASHADAADFVSEYSADAALAADAAVGEASAGALAADLFELTKPGISAFLVVTAATGYLLGDPAPLDWPRLAGLLVGTALTAGGAGAMNHAAEAVRDARMQRTARRPVPAGRVPASGAATFGVGLVVAGLVILLLATNGLTVALAALTVALYIGAYTPLKSRSTWNTLVGTVPGALPALGGYAAAVGALNPTGWAAFAVVALWQIPHFLALAWLYREDYARGGFRMLPSTDRAGTLTGGCVLAASLALLPVGMLPAAMGATGWIYLVGMAALGTAFTLPAFSFAAAPTDARARRVLVASFAYVPAFFALVLLDWLVG
jgi:protoheme IX farnesyltransferase